MPALKRQYTADDLDDFPNDGNRYEVIDGGIGASCSRMCSFCHRRMENGPGNLPMYKLMIAVAVLSPGTACVDRIEKRDLFRSEGVPKYWIADCAARTMERYTPQAAQPEMHTEQLRCHSEGASQPFILDIADYFAEVFDQ